jgi:uncharacterized protein DUF6496
LERFHRIDWSRPFEARLIGDTTYGQDEETQILRSSRNEVKSEMCRYKRGTAKSGRGGKGGRVKSRKQAVAIGLSKARRDGKNVPPRKAS